MIFQPDLDLSEFQAQSLGDALTYIRAQQQTHVVSTAKRARSVALSPEAAYVLGAPTELWGMGVVVRAQGEA